MPHETALLATVAASFGLAFVCGMVAVRLRLPPLVGYLLAGVVLGPFSPGWVADVALAGQLAELGVILLMFGVGLHFSPGDLLAVRRVAVPGALLQMALAASLGCARSDGKQSAGADASDSRAAAVTRVVLASARADRVCMMGRASGSW